MSYRDRTFCPFWSDCASQNDCGRALTPEVLAAAARWWGSTDAPICQYAERPSCFLERSATTSESDNA